MKGKKILITRAADDNKELRENLERKGAQVFELPTIQFEPVKDLSQIHNYLDQLDTIDWIVFTSAKTVEFFFAIAQKHGVKLYFYPDLKIATVGEKTKLKLEQLGYRTNFVPIKYTAEVLAENMDEAIEGKNILIPRSDLASNEYISVFERRQANPIPVTVYHNTSVKHSKTELESIMNEKLDYLTFTSGSTFTSFHANLQSNQVQLMQEKIVCIGPSTAKVVNELGYEVSAIAEPYTTDGIIAAIEKIEQDV